MTRARVCVCFQLPYVIDEKINSDDDFKAKVTDAIEHWTTKTTIKFVDISGQENGRNYVEFQSAAGAITFRQ